MTDKKLRYSLHMTAAQVETLKQLAEKLCVTPGQLVRDLIGDTAKKNGLPWNDDSFTRRSPNGINKRLQKKG